MAIFRVDSKDKSYVPIENKFKIEIDLIDKLDVSQSDILPNTYNPLLDDYNKLSSVLGLTVEHIKKKENFQEVVDTITKIKIEKFEDVIKPIKHTINYLSKNTKKSIEDGRETGTIGIRTLDVVKNPDKAAKVIHDRSIVTINRMANGLTEFKMALEHADLVKKHQAKKFELMDEEGKIQETFDKDQVKIEAFTLEEIDTISKRTLIFVALGHAIQNAELKKTETKKDLAEKTSKENNLLEGQFRWRIELQKTVASRITFNKDNNESDLNAKMEVIFTKFLEMLEDIRQETEKRIKEKLQEQRENLRRVIKEDNLSSDIKEEDTNKYITNKDNLKVNLKNIFLTVMKEIKLA